MRTKQKIIKIDEQEFSTLRKLTTEELSMVFNLVMDIIEEKVDKNTKFEDRFLNLCVRILIKDWVEKNGR